MPTDQSPFDICGARAFSGPLCVVEHGRCSIHRICHPGARCATPAINKSPDEHTCSRQTATKSQACSLPTTENTTDIETARSFHTSLIVLFCSLQSACHQAVQSPQCPDLQALKTAEHCLRQSLSLSASFEHSKTLLALLKCFHCLQALRTAGH